MRFLTSIIFSLLLIIPFNAKAGLFDKHSVFKNGSIVSEVIVNVDQELSDGDTRLTEKRFNVATQIKDKLIEILNKKRRLDSSGDLTLDILIRDIRLRDAGATALVGIMAGVDSLKINTLVLKNSVPLVEFNSRSSASNNPSEESRMNEMINGVSWSVYRAIKGERMPKDNTPKRHASRSFSSQEGDNKARGVSAASSSPELGSGSPIISPEKKGEVFSAKDKLIKLKTLHGAGLITDQEYSEMKRKVLDSM